MMAQRASKSCIVPPAFFYFLLCWWWTLEYCKFSLLTLVSGIFLDCLFPISVISVGFREERTWNYLMFSTIPICQVSDAGINISMLEIREHSIFILKYLNLKSIMPLVKWIKKTFILYMQNSYIIFLFKEKKKEIQKQPTFSAASAFNL